MTACPRCPAEWGGTNTAHCGAAGCHQTFTGPTAFDKHRAGYGERGQCKSPARVGLVEAGRGYSCWALPGARPVPVEVASPVVVYLDDNDTVNGDDDA